MAHGLSRFKFRRDRLSPFKQKLSPLCREEADTPRHVLLRCSALMITRHRLLGSICPNIEDMRIAGRRRLGGPGPLGAAFRSFLSPEAEGDRYASSLIRRETTTTDMFLKSKNELGSFKLMCSTVFRSHRPFSITQSSKRCQTYKLAQLRSELGLCKRNY